MSKARIGIIGVGWWGTVGHLEPLSADPKTELVAVWSRTESKAQERAERYGVPRHFTDYRAIVDQCKLDGVIIASTPNMHYEQARYALEHGLHVLMEKPFVLRAAHANELQRLAREHDLLLSVCHPLLFYPTVVQARNQIREGIVGDILLITALFSQRVYDLYKGHVPDRFHAPPGRGDVPRPNATSYSTTDYNGYRPNRNDQPQYVWKAPKDGLMRAYEIDQDEFEYFATLAEFRKNIGQEYHGIEVDFDIFKTLKQPGKDARAVYQAEQLGFSLRPESVAVDAGVSLPNVNEDHSGSGPDLGAYELGSPAPIYGPRGKDD